MILASLSCFLARPFALLRLVRLISQIKSALSHVSFELVLLPSISCEAASLLNTEASCRLFPPKNRAVTVHARTSIASDFFQFFAAAACVASTK